MTGSIEAVPVEAVDGTWFVFWESPQAYGSRGRGLTREAAENIAQRIRDGEVKP